MNFSLPDPKRLTCALLLLFGFSAWNLTGVANAALGLLSLLFLLDLPRHWQRLRRDPGFLLMLGGLGLTTLLALRAAWLLPDTASDQWDSIGGWSAPFLLVVTAWWLRGDERLIQAFLIAAAAGLVVGVLRKSDWSLLDEILGGLRYHFGYAALGLAFLVSVMLAGLILFRRRILHLTLGGVPRPALGWALWLLGLAFSTVVLVVTEARGAALSLALVATGYALLQVRQAARRSGLAGPHLRMALGTVIAVLALTSVVLWTSRERIYYDWKSLAPDPVASAETRRVRYDSSTAIRLNLYRLGLELFAARPLLGWGPGTNATEYLVPNRAILISDYDVSNASRASHLHSVPIEILVRFGLAGAALALSFLTLMAKTYRRVWALSQDPELKHFLLIGGILTLLFCIYDFRIIHLDLRFFFIAFFGIVYGYSFADDGPAIQDGAEADR